jgi:hypothetical protein
VIWTRAYPRDEYLKGAILGEAPALHANIRLGWKGMPGANIPDYYENLKKMFHNI